MEDRLKILLLEDNPADAELIQLTLKRAGLAFNAVVAGDETEFLSALQDNRFHAVLADNALPQYNSIEALNLVRATNPHVAFILVTGTVSEEFAVNIIKQGADDYILKTNLTRLYSSITGAIAKKRIQEQKEIAEIEMEREKEFSGAIINSLPGIFFLCNREGRCILWNNNFQRISGYGPDLIAAMPVTHFFSGKDRVSIENYCKAGFANGHAATEAGFMNLVQKERPYYITGKVIKFGNQDCLINVGVDIAASKKSEKESQALTTDLRRISARLESMKEEEQARIAREVHDQLGQLLTGLKMDLSWLKNKIDKPHDTAVLLEKISEMSAVLDEAVKTVRRVASDLRPPILDDYGLAEALEWQGSEFAKRSGIAVYYDPPVSQQEISKNTSTGLFRVYQEILTNIARHAHAGSVITTLEFKADQLVLTVTDDGKGFDTSVPIKSLGLLGMKERVYMLGGEIDISSAPGVGTSIAVTAPYATQSY